MTNDLPYIAIRHERAAAAKGAPVVLLHGIMSRGDSDFPAERWVKPLLAAGRDVFVVDLPGHGGSRRIGTADEGTVARIVAAIADAIRGAGPVDVVAYSLGARVAWALAARNPGLVHAMVLGGLAPMEPFAVFNLAAARAFVDGGDKPADPMTGFLAGMFASTGDGHSLINLAEGLAREPFDPAAEAPKAAVLFAAGQDDQMASGIAILEPRVAGSRTVRVPGDHMGALHSDEFRREAFAFLGLAS